MDSFTLIVTVTSATTAVISVLLAYVAYREARKAAKATQTQADKATEANDQARRIGQSDAIIHFTSRFFDLMKEGADFTNDKWAYQFWSLQSTEFYFFHNGWIPAFMYRLWMVELASLYLSSKQIWGSHDIYLSKYPSSYREMVEFFQEIKDIALRNPNNVQQRNINVEISTNWL